MKCPRLAVAIVASCLVGPSFGQVLGETCDSPQLAFGGANGTPSTTTHQIVVSDSMIIGDLHVAMEITHSWIGDVHLELVSPTGTTLLLQGGDGGDADDLDLIYADGGLTYASVAFDFGCHMQASGGPLAVFAGENSAGTWTLRLRDDYPSSADGVLESWCLRFFSNSLGSLPPAIQNLACAPTNDGAVLTWSNPGPYDSLEIVVDGATAALLPGSATTHTVDSMPIGVPFVVGVEGRTVLGAPSCREDCIVVPLGPPPLPKTDKLVLVVIDGLRYSEGFGDPTRQHVPQMGALAAQGTIVEPFRNDGGTYTSRAIPAIMCGSWEAPIDYFDPLCNEDNQYSARPMVHEYFRRQLGQPGDECPYVLGAYCPWRGSFHPAYGQAYWPDWVGVWGGDDANWAAAQTILTLSRPKFLTLYLADVDHAGHSGVFADYLAAIENADAIVGDLWTFLQADPEYAGRTTLLVTNDHGRHETDFSGHGDDCDGCRDIQFLAVGLGVKAGHVSTVPRSIPDIVPTIGALLGFHTEFADGEVMGEILAPCPAVPSDEVVRLGSPPNPRAFLPGVTRGPIIGAAWDPVVTPFHPGALLDFIGVDLVAPINVSTAWGTLLVNSPPEPQLFFNYAPGTPFSIGIPADCAYVGMSAWTQGGSVALGPDIALANGLDIVFGTY